MQLPDAKAPVLGVKLETKMSCQNMSVAKFCRLMNILIPDWSSRHDVMKILEARQIVTGSSVSCICGLAVKLSSLREDKFSFLVLTAVVFSG